jgi:hypothetical protein
MKRVKKQEIKMNSNCNQNLIRQEMTDCLSGGLDPLRIFTENAKVLTIKYNHCLLSVPCIVPVMYVRLCYYSDT